MVIVCVCVCVCVQQKSEAEKHAQDKELELVNAAVHHQEELDRLRAETAILKQNYERKIEEKEAALRAKEREVEATQQNLQREGEAQDLRANLQRVHSQLQLKEREM